MVRNVVSEIEGLAGTKERTKIITNTGPTR